MERYEGMTPAQLRRLADEMEAGASRGISADEHERRLSAIRGFSEVEEPVAPGYMRHVEVDGIRLDIDMRRVKDLRTLRLVAKINEKGPGSLQATLDLADFILGDQREKVEAVATDSDGFVDAERYTSIFMKLFQEVGAKN